MLSSEDPGVGLSGLVNFSLEASSTVGLLMHMNGTYRAHWADRLGLCKGGGAPLAFRCIKGMGGPVPSTLIGVTRIYHVLYRERLSNGGFIRISAKDALDAEYFWTDPLPCDPRSLPKYESSHEFQTKKKRQQQRQNEEMAKRQKLQHPQQHARLIACFCRHDKEGNAGFVFFEFMDYALHPCPTVWLRNTSFLMRATS
ncbi:Cyclin-dependent kinase C-2 [Camellia lanceoleosa]|uniref:Cyclin-dependent kinase C-2 n=1 Tax=Camellia lanceoleosa TaxID=1840588 RepID=A0ACC0HJ48_9ERIC|nr:Cyclin-dependent kinase C-2 [Camellia lanceoleosa]